MVGSDPTISEAKILSKKYYKRGVLILSFNDEGEFGKFHLATYGQDKEKCEAMAKVSAAIAHAIQTGRIRVAGCLFGNEGTEE